LAPVRRSGGHVGSGLHGLLAAVLAVIVLITGGTGALTTIVGLVAVL